MMQAVMSPQSAAPDAALSLDKLARELVRDLQTPRPAAYWTDFLLTSLIGWTAFALAVYYPPFSPPMALAAVIATFSLYRGLLFVHEISHFTRGGMEGFETAWNLLSGYPLLLPSFVYCGVHQDHHRISLYGTERDPEYLPFGHSRGMTICFALESFLIPVLLVIRFVAAAPLGLLWPPLHRWLAVHASSLVINFKYCRDLSGGLERKMRRSEVAVLALWGTAVLLAARGVLPWRTFAVWLMVVSVASFVNTLRTLCAHHYESDGAPMDRTGQLLDSIDHPGQWWTGLWAPVGLRYHALHHYFPGIPYHNLAEAYRRLASTLPAAAEFHRSTDPSLPHSLRTLLANKVRVTPAASESLAR
jgi:fatty acid desaturase